MSKLKRDRNNSMEAISKQHAWDGKRYLSYCIRDFREGKLESFWCIDTDEFYSRCVLSIVTKSLTYLGVIFDCKFRLIGGYWSFSIKYKD